MIPSRSICIYFGQKCCYRSYMSARPLIGAQTTFGGKPLPVKDMAINLKGKKNDNNL